MTSPLSDVDLRLVGSSTLGAVATPRLVAGFFKHLGAATTTTTEERAERRVVVRAVVSGKPMTAVIAYPGTGGGFEALGMRSCDVALASRPISASEAERFSGLGDKPIVPEQHVVAMDGIAIVVHRNNPLTELPLTDVARVFRGEITHWGALGGRKEAIRVYRRDAHSGTHEGFVQMALGGKDDLSEKALVREDNMDVASAVAADPHGIGYVTLASMGQARALELRDGESSAHAPDRGAVSTEEYPLARRLFFYTLPRPSNPIVAPFVEFALSDEGQHIVSDAGLVSLDVRTITRTPPPGAPKLYREAIAGAQRLSFNFRFVGQTAELDARSLRDIERLARFLRASASEVGTLALLGFTDGSPHDAKAQALSRRRAHVVAEKLRERGIEPAVVEGFGGAMPVASNDTVRGREKNRRIEIWLR